MEGVEAGMITNIFMLSFTALLAKRGGHCSLPSLRLLLLTSALPGVSFKDQI